MREMKDSNVNWLNTIPCDWALSRIKYVLNERIEKNDPIKTKDILSLTAKQGVVPLSEKEGGGNKPKEDVTAYKLAYPNDIVINSMNILSGSVGLCKYFGCVSPVYYMLRPFHDNFDVRYFNYIFQTKVFQLSLFGLGNGILIKESSNGKFNTIRMRIPMEKFGNLLIPVPNEKEQITISNYLDTQCSEIDATAEDIQKEISLLEDYKKSVITEAVTKGLNPDAEMKDSGIEWIGDIPKNWVTIRIGNIFSLRNERNYLPMEQVQLLSLYSGKGVFPTGEEGTTNSGNHAQTVADYKIVKRNDIVVNIILAWMGSLGISNYDGVVSPAYDVYIPDEEKVIPHYYHYVFRTSGIANECYRYGRGIMMMRWRTYSSEFKRIHVPFPSFDEQQQIADYLDSKCSEIDALITDKKRQLDILADYKKSLIYEYVTGKKEVPVNE